MKIVVNYKTNQSKDAVAKIDQSEYIQLANYRISPNFEVWKDVKIQYYISKKNKNATKIEDVKYFGVVFKDQPNISFQKKPFEMEILNKIDLSKIKRI